MKDNDDDERCTRKGHSVFLNDELGENLKKKFKKQSPADFLQKKNAPNIPHFLITLINANENFSHQKHVLVGCK